MRRRQSTSIGLTAPKLDKRINFFNIFKSLTLTAPRKFNGFDDSSDNGVGKKATTVDRRQFMLAVMKNPEVNKYFTDTELDQLISGIKKDEANSVVKSLWGAAVRSDISWEEFLCFLHHIESENSEDKRKGTTVIASSSQDGLSMLQFEETLIGKSPHAIIEMSINNEGFLHINTVIKMM